MNKLQKAFIKTVDPEYIHLISSINLAEGNVKIQSIESPATPLYVLGAITTKITSLITSVDSLKEDFISNPEKYIITLRLVLLVITTFSLILLGKVVQKVSNSLLIMMLFQLAPFLSVDIMFTSTIFTPDHFLVILMLVYISFIFSYINKDGNNYENKHAIYFSVFTAMGCATKITFLPLVILPIFILPKMKQKIVFTLSTCFLCPLFAFTATIQYDRFYSWVKGLIFHSGNYGTGEEKIINSTSFKNNLLKIIGTEIPFIIICVLLIICAIVLLIKNNKKNQHDHSRIIFGLLCTFILHIILVSKHFAIRYLTPSILLSVLGIYLLILFYSQNKRVIKTLIVCFVVIYPLMAFKRIYNINNHLSYYTKSRNSAHEYIEKNLKDKPLLVIPNYFGSGSKEYALWFATKWVGQNVNEYTDLLYKKYPNTYFYIPDNDKYHNWKNETSMFDILKSNPILNLYISLDATEKKEESFGKEILEKINYFNSSNDSIIKIKYLFHETYDMICQLKIDTSRLVKIFNYQEAFCDMERLTNDEKYYKSNHPSFSFNNNKLRTSQKSFSGKYSEKLTKDFVFGTGCKIENVHVGDYLEATIWKLCEDNNCLLVCSAKSPQDFYTSSNSVIEEKNGWKKIKLSLSIDKNIVANSLNFYVWYNGNNICYCDDFKIIIGKKRRENLTN